MRFSAKSLFVLATITCSIFAKAAPAAEPVDDSVAITQNSNVHVRDFSSIIPRNGAAKCEAKLKQCKTAAAKRCKGKKSKCEADTACKTANTACMAKYVHPVTDDQDGEDCGICLQTFAKGQGDIKTLSCNHFFDKACIKEWLSTPGAKRSCPMCRKPLD